MNVCFKTMKHILRMFIVLPYFYKEYMQSEEKKRKGSVLDQLEIDKGINFKL